MRRHVLLPCACGEIHRIPDPGADVHLRCDTTGASLTYESHHSEGHYLRGRLGDIPLEDESIELGRRARLVINHPTLSRRHCCFLRDDDGGYTVVDLESSNGTFLNEEAIVPGAPVPLQGGDLVRMGDILFRYLAPQVEDDGIRHPDLTVEQMNGTGLSLSTVDDESDRLTGRSLGGYKLLSVMSQGGMGRIYRAEEEATGRPCVLKTIIPDDTSEGNVIERFIHEMDFSLRIQHPNIVECFNVGQVGRALYIVMEYLPGKNLRDWYQHRQASTEAAVLIGRQVAAALKAAHEEGVIHRDIKPENIIMDNHARTKVVDFGIAKLRNATDATRITLSGAVVGTLQFLSPEQVAGRRDFGPPVDLYALGAVLYFCLTGRAPYQERNILQLHKSMKLGPLPPSNFRKGISPALENVVLRCLATKLHIRYTSAEELLADLNALPVHI